jgi:hypothetical protein
MFAILIGLGVLMGAVLFAAILVALTDLLEESGRE